MLEALALSLLVAIAIVSVPRVMCRLVLGVSWQIPSFRGWATQTFLAVLFGTFILCARGLGFAASIGAVGFVGTVVYFAASTRNSWRLQSAFKGLREPQKREASLTTIDELLERRRTKALRSSGLYESYA